jgi:TPR repeat protein
MVGRFFGTGGTASRDQISVPEAVFERPVPPCQSDRERRLALVIGNGRYLVDPLPNAVADMRLIARILPALGFETTDVENATSAQLSEAIGRFAADVTSAGANAVAFVFFAGHGIQIHGTNYLLPVDATPEAPQSGAFPLAGLVSLIAASQAKAAVLVIDACRRAPEGATGLSAGSTGGLAAIDRPPDGMLIAYSTAAGMIAADGHGANSPYAEALAQALPGLLEPETRIHEVFIEAAERVRAATEGAQSPSLYLQGALPSLTVTEDDRTRFRTWNFAERPRFSGRVLQWVGVLSVALLILAGAHTWFGAYPEMRTRWLHDWNIVRSSDLEVRCNDVAVDRFGVVKGDWCRRSPDELLASAKTNAGWSATVSAREEHGDAVALLLRAEDIIASEPGRRAEAVTLALRAARGGFLPAWETVVRLQQIGTERHVDLREARAGLQAADRAGILPASISLAWLDWFAGQFDAAEERFRRADKIDETGTAALRHGESLLNGLPQAARIADVPAAAERFRAACEKGNADAGLYLLKIADRRLSDGSGSSQDACLAKAANGPGATAAYLKALLHLRADTQADPAETRRLLTVAAEAGRIDAMVLLASAHGNAALGPASDAGEAVAWAERAAAAGDLAGQNLLAFLLTQGAAPQAAGPPIALDPARARQLLESGVRAGSNEAALLLAHLHAGRAFPDSDGHKVRALAEMVQADNSASPGHRRDAAVMLERSERSLLLSALPPSEFRFGSRQARQLLTILIPWNCEEQCRAFLPDILPQVVGSLVPTELIAFELRLVAPSRTEDAAECQRDGGRAGENLTDAIASWPHWQDLDPRARGDLQRAMIGIFLKGCAPSPEERAALAPYARAGGPVVIINGWLLDRSSVATILDEVAANSDPETRRKLLRAISGSRPPDVSRADRN